MDDQPEEAESALEFVHAQLNEIDQVLRQEDQTSLLRALSKNVRLVKGDGFTQANFVLAVNADLGFEYSEKERRMFVMVLDPAGADWIPLGRVEWVLKHTLQELLEEERADKMRLRYLSERALFVSPDPDYVKNRLTSERLVDVLFMHGRMQRTLVQDIDNLLLFNSITHLWNTQQDLSFVETQLTLLFDKLTGSTATTDSSSLARLDMEQVLMAFDHTLGNQLVLGNQQTFSKSEFVDLFYWLGRVKADWLSVNFAFAYAPVLDFAARSRQVFNDNSTWDARLQQFFSSSEITADSTLKSLSDFRSLLLKNIKQDRHCRYSRPFAEEVMKTRDAIKQGVIGGPAVEIGPSCKPSFVLLRPSLEISNVYINDPLFIEAARIELVKATPRAMPPSAGCCGSPKRAVMGRQGRSSTAGFKEQMMERLLSGGAAYNRSQLERFTQIRIFEVLGGGVGGPAGVRILRSGWWKGGNYVGCVWESGIAEDGKIARVDSEMLTCIPNAANLQGLHFRFELVKYADGLSARPSSIASVDIPSGSFFAASGDKSYALSAGVTVNLRLNRPTNANFKEAVLLPEHFLTLGTWWLALFNRLRLSVAMPSDPRLLNAFRLVMDDFHRRRLFARELRGVYSGSLEDALSDSVSDEILMTAAFRAHILATAERGNLLTSDGHTTNAQQPSSLTAGNLRFLEPMLSGNVPMRPLLIPRRAYFEDLAIN